MAATAPTIAAIVLAGGSGTRLGLSGDRNKVHLGLGGRPLLAWSLRTLDRHPGVAAVVLVARPGDDSATAAAVAAAEVAGPIEVVAGGATRTESEQAGVAALHAVLGPRSAVVLVHDGARPFLDRRLIDDLVAGAVEAGVAVPGLPLDDDVVEVELDGRTRAAPAGLHRVQTPQAVRSEVMWPAYRRAAERGLAAADTAELVVAAGGPSALVVPGDEENIKVTVPVDLPTAEAIAARRGWPDG